MTVHRSRAAATPEQCARASLLHDGARLPLDTVARAMDVPAATAAHMVALGRLQAVDGVVVLPRGCGRQLAGLVTGAPEAQVHQRGCDACNRLVEAFAVGIAAARARWTCAADEAPATSPPEAEAAAVEPAPTDTGLTGYTPVWAPPVPRPTAVPPVPPGRPAVAAVPLPPPAPSWTAVSLADRPVADFTWAADPVPDDWWPAVRTTTERPATGARHVLAATALLAMSGTAVTGLGLAPGSATPAAPAPDPAAAVAPAQATTTAVRLDPAHPPAEPVDVAPPDPPSPPGLPARMAVAGAGIGSTTPATTTPVHTPTSQSATPPPTTVTAVDVGDPATWDALASCESSGSWAADTGNGYYGGLQFLPSSWALVGGQGMPHEASRAEQIARAQQLWQIQGWRAWPVCSRLLGYR